LYEGKAILISGNGSYTGRTIFVDEGFDLYQRTYACVNNTETDILPYLYFSILRFLSLKIGGGTHGSAIPYIVYDDIAKDTFSYNFEVVSKFQKIINPILSNIKSTDIQTINLTELRDWLLPMLMNGQVNVKEEKETELSMAAEPKMKYGK
jgi:type I restriction enzyme S subunit